jgi:uracil-DNA glycosylase
MSQLVEALSRVELGTTHNQYADSPLRRKRLADYLRARRGASIVLVGEAAGYNGARVSGIAFTSERQLTGDGPAELSATIVHRTLAELGIADDVLLWNLVPTHPHRPGIALSNRRPTAAEIAGGLPFVVRVAKGRRVFAVGRLAQQALGATYVRHPAHGGAAEFHATLAACL